MKAYTITVNGTAYEVEVEEKGGAVAAAPRAAAPAPRAAAPAPKAAPAPAPAPAAKPVAAGAATVTAPMPGKVLEVKCKLTAPSLTFAFPQALLLTPAT